MRFTRFNPAPGVAGCGVVTARGDGLDGLIGPDVEGSPAPDAMRIDLEALCALPSSQFRRLDEYGALGVAAARQALRAAGVPRAEAPGPGWGVMIGSSTGCGASNARHHRALRDRAKGEPNASDFVRTVANAVNGDISIALRCTGPAQTFVSGWTAGAEALLAAGAELENGRTRCVLAGGIEAGLSAPPAPRPTSCGAILLMGSDGRASEPGALRLAAFWRGHDPDGRWSPAGALDALHPRRFARIVIANTIPADRLARWRAEAGGTEMLDLPRRIGEPGAAGAAVAAAMASRLDGPSLVIAHDPAGGIAALALVR
jgi:hypothetical protein